MSIDTVNDLPARVQYVASTSQTVFPYPFPIFADGDLVVDVDGTVKTLTTHYTVSGAGDDAGGNVTFVTAPGNGKVVTIYRDTEIARTSDFQQNGPLSSSTINDDLDRLVVISQELKAMIQRCLRIPQTAEVDGDDISLTVANFANKYLTFDADGKPTPAVLSDATMTQAITGNLLWPRTAAEIAAGVTPTNYAYAPGHAWRYNFLPANSAATNATALTAIQTLANASQHEITIPPGAYALPAGTVLTLSGDSSVNAYGAQFTNMRVLIQTSTAKRHWKGGTFIVADSTSTAVMRIADGAQNVYVEDTEFIYGDGGSAGALCGIYILGDAGHETAYVWVTNYKTTSNAARAGLWVQSAHDVHLRNLTMISTSSTPDDSLVLKAIGRDTYAVTIDGVLARGHHNAFAIGTELTADVYAVTAANLVGVDTQAGVYLKPGGGGYNGGTISGITITGVSMYDPDGTRAAKVLWLLARDASTLRDITISNVVAHVRAASGSSNRFAVYLHALSGDITGVRLSNIRVRDAENGAAGTAEPLDQLVELRADTGATLSDITFNGATLVGAKNSGININDGGGTIEDILFRDVAVRHAVVNPAAGSDSAFRSETAGFSVKNLILETDTANREFFAGDNDFTAEKVDCYFGSVVAGTPKEVVVFRAPVPCYVYQARITDVAGIAADATDYVTFTLYKGGSSGSALATLATNATALTACAAALLDPTGSNALNIPITSAAFLGRLNAGDIITMKAVHSSAGKAITEMGVALRWVPFA